MTAPAPSRACLALALALSACGGPWQSADLATLPVAAEYPGAYAVVLLDETTVEFHAGLDGKPVADVTRHVWQRVLRPGAEELGTVAVPYKAAMQRVIAFAARTVSPDERVRRFDDYLDRPIRDGEVLYSDDRVVTVSVEPVSPGSVIEYRYTVRHQEPRHFQFHRYFADRYPARAVRLQVRAPAEWTLEHMARRLGESFDFPPAVTSEGTERVLTWERRDVAAMGKRALAPPLALRAPAVTVRLAAWKEGTQPVQAPRDPRELSAWMVGFLAPVAAHDEELRPQVKELLEGVPDDPELRARRLYGWVRDNVAYCAIEVGYGGWLPHQAPQVHAHRYGDCKDKANLLRAMLAIAGIGSRPVLISAHDGYPRPFEFPVLTGNFNHMVLQVDLPSGSVLTDPTARTAPFGQLPTSDQEAPCLPISDPGSPLLLAPASTDGDNVRRTDFALDLTPDGAASGGFHLTATGHDAGSLRGLLLSAPEADRARDTVRWLGVPGGEWSTATFERARPPAEPTPVEASGSLRIAHFVAAEGKTRLLRIADVAPRMVPLLDEGERHEPVVWPVRHQRVERWRVRLPASLRPSSLPERTSIAGTLGSYHLAWSSEGDALVIDRRLVLREHIIPEARLAELRQFLDQVLAAEARAVVLKEVAR